MEFLTFQLYGPMASWGNVAVGEYRPSSIQASKSAIMGLLAAALGILREEEQRLQNLFDGFGFAVRVDAPGELMRDYHTAQVPPARKGVYYYTRQDELGADKLNTILSQRDYRVDASSVVLLWEKEQAPYRLAALKAALQKPKLSLYLGRKACPVALPLHPREITANTLRAAFDQVMPCAALQALPTADAVTWYWEELANFPAGMEADMRYARRDRLLSRKRWQYAHRQEYARLEQKGER